MNRDNMSRSQLIALVNELEAQNAELRARIDDVRRARSIGDGVDALFDLGEPQEHRWQRAAGGIVPVMKLPASNGRLHPSCDGDLNVTNTPNTGWIAIEHGTATDEAISELRQGLVRLLEEVRDFRRDIEACSRVRSA